MNNWKSTKTSLPKNGQYVLVHLVRDNWKDSDDQEGCLYRVCKFVKGISMVERNKMEKGEIPSYKESGWCLSTGNTDTERYNIIKGCDQYGNNKVAYNWEEFGPSSFFGQDVDFWMPIKRIKGN